MSVPDRILVAGLSYFCILQLLLHEAAKRVIGEGGVHDRSVVSSVYSTRFSFRQGVVFVRSDGGVQELILNIDKSSAV